MKLLEIFLLFILPPALIRFGIISLNSRLIVLFSVIAVIIAIVIKEKWTFKKLGFRIDNFKSSFLPYLLFSVVAGLGITILANLLGGKHTLVLWLDPHFQYWFLILSLAQEFAYRGFLMPRLQEIFKSPLLIIFVNSIIFAFLHIIYPNPSVNLSLTLAGGLGFATLYYKYPNIFLVTISHAVLNVLTVYYCFVGFTHCR